MADRIVIEGRDMQVVDSQLGSRSHNPKRKRPPEYIPAAPADGVDLVALNRMLGEDNRYWSTDANDWADAHPEVRPKDAARKWRKHRIEEA